MMGTEVGGLRLDCHHHLWSVDRIAQGGYEWMPDGGLLREDYLPERLAPHLSHAGVGGSVVIQADPSVAETHFLLDLARTTDFVLGVTGWVPLDQPSSIDLLAELAQNPYLRAIRPMIHDIPDPLWATHPQVRRGLRVMSELGLRFEVLTFAEHLPAAHTALASIPELPAVINHLSKPVFHWADDGEWRTWMARHAERPTTFCKLSGMLTEVGPGWRDSHFQPYVDFLFEHFGPERVIFGSDWPVSRQLLDYPDLLELTARLVSALSPQEAECFWRRNGERFYGVEVPPRTRSAADASRVTR